MVRSTKRRTGGEMTSPQTMTSVTLPGRLGHPEFELRTDPRSDPRMVRALAAHDMDRLAAPAPVSPADPIEARLDFIGAAEEGFEQFFREPVADPPTVTAVAH